MIAARLLALGLAAWAGLPTLPAGAQPPTPTPTPASTPTPPPDLILDGRRVQLDGRHVFRRVVLTNRAQIEIKPYSGPGDGGRLELVAARIEIDRGSQIVGDAAGYRGQLRGDGEGPGGGEGGASTADGGGGGAYGGDGGDGVLDNVPTVGALGGRVYGTDCGPDLEPGSAGGAPGRADNRGDPGIGGHGGAALVLIADTVLITGTISVGGEDGVVAANDAAGGGAGGGVLVRAGRLQQTGRIAADGGDGGVTDDGGGGGGGGRIKLFYASGTVTRRALSVAGGQGDGNGRNNDGKLGTICVQLFVPTPTATLAPSATATDTPAPSATPTATPADTATPTGEPTATPTDPPPTSTATPTPSPTATLPPTATPTPAPLYLPVLLWQACPAVDARPVALALVVDASESMTGPTRAGRSKIEAALEAARVLVDLASQARGDRLAVVVFNAEARVLAPLTGDRAALRAALARVPTARGSRLDAGVALAGAVLAAVDPANPRWMIVLTDGLPSPSTPADARAAAAAARTAGIVVDTIGVGVPGVDVDADLLRGMASAPSRYHEAPDAEDLPAIFAELVWRPPTCRGLPAWP